MRKRIIPVLSLYDNKLVVTINFNKRIYIGDPINAVKILNHFKADELIILDIGARQNKPTNMKIIESMFDEAYMPVSFGGGIENIHNPNKIIKSGAERIIINSQLVSNNINLEKLVDSFGAQSIVGSIDLYFDSIIKDYFIFSPLLQKKIIYTKLLHKLEKLNIGELIINFIENDGTFKGLNLNFYKKINNAINIPVISCGGASSIKDMVNSINLSNCNAAAAAALFAFRNNNYDSIMINYPNQNLLNKAFK